MQNSLPRLIVIEGTIAVGKTTAAKELAELLSYEVLLEPVKANPYLGMYYDDPGRWALPMQMFMLLKRVKMHVQADEMLRSGDSDGVIIDRGIAGDGIFAYVNYRDRFISRLEYGTYQEYYRHLTDSIDRHDLIIHLLCTPGIAYSRHRERSREEEKGIPMEYFEKLHKAHDDMLGQIEKVARVDWNTYRRSAEVLVTVIKEWTS